MVLTKRDFETLANRFAKSAETLMISGQNETARYLRGFSLESRLKSRICRNIKAGTFPEKTVPQTHYVHSVKILLETAGLTEALDSERARNKAFRESYQIVSAWTPELRYDSSPISNRTVTEFFNACREFESWLSKN